MTTNIGKYFSILIAAFAVNNYAHRCGERIVTDLEVIQGQNGVPIEFWYSEWSSVNGFESVPGCPKSIDGHPLVYYGYPPRCYMAGFKGPCQDGEKLFIKFGSMNGQCACECLLESETQDYFNHDGKHNARYVGCSNCYSTLVQIYDKQIGKCYTQYEKGPCVDDTVITDCNSTNISCGYVCNEHAENVYRETAECTLVRNSKKVMSSCGPALGQGECDKRERYSRTLRKCVKIMLNKRLVIG